MKKLLYNLLDLVTLKRGVSRHVSGFTLKVPARYIRYFPSNYELSNITFLNERLGSGMTVIDVGAHIGLLSVIMAQKVGSSGKVFAFEPTPSTFRILEEIIRINRLNDIVVPIKKAVSEEPGKTNFYVTDIEAHNSNSLANTKRDYGNEHEISVELVTIDETVLLYDLPKVDFLKIDAEGAEYSVLKGGRKTIKKDKPAISLSLHPESIMDFGDSLAEIWGFIEEHEYTVVYKNEILDRQYFISQKGLFDVFLI